MSTWRQSPTSINEDSYCIIDNCKKAQYSSLTILFFCYWSRGPILWSDSLYSYAIHTFFRLRDIMCLHWWKIDQR